MSENGTNRIQKFFKELNYREFGIWLFRLLLPTYIGLALVKLLLEIGVSGLFDLALIGFFISLMFALILVKTGVTAKESLKRWQFFIFDMIFGPYLDQALDKRLSQRDDDEEEVEKNPNQLSLGL